jgi:hypothetical protein
MMAPVCFQAYRQGTGSNFPPKCLAKASASSGSAKQNTTTSLSFWRMK